MNSISTKINTMEANNSKNYRNISEIDERLKNMEGKI